LAKLPDSPQIVLGDVSPFGIEVLTPDELLSALISKYPVQMLVAHERTVSRLRGATDTSTLEALKRAGAPAASGAMGSLLGFMSR
jgi:hypothetical protein